MHDLSDLNVENLKNLVLFYKKKFEDAEHLSFILQLKLNNEVEKTKMEASKAREFELMLVDHKILIAELEKKQKTDKNTKLEEKTKVVKKSKE